MENLKLARMESEDLDEVMAIENSVYTHPWTRPNFVDSLAQHYDAWVVRSVDNVLIGYFVQMLIVDEVHLLTIAVKEKMQGQGIGTYLLKYVIERAGHMQSTAISLEVRVSNLRAIAMYEAVGFLLVGRRKNYYQTRLNHREDALILRYSKQGK
ncbi:MAG: rimI [Solimicrobium sp.]|jgi:ribosomal-protein-alanine N-acetyltransferase|nr:rimI [Solimicrobium sp.]